MPLASMSDRITGGSFTLFERCNSSTGAPSQTSWQLKGLTRSAPGCFATRGRASMRSKGSPLNPARVIVGCGRRRGMERSQATDFEFALASIGIFASLPPKALQALRDTCSWQNYHPADPIVDYLDSSDDVFFVTTGEVSVTIYSVSGKAVSFRNLGPAPYSASMPQSMVPPDVPALWPKPTALLLLCPPQHFEIFCWLSQWWVRP